MEREIARFTIDFKALKDFKDINNKDLPVYSFATIYRYLGLYDFVQKYYEENNLKHGTFSYINNVFANVDTILKIKHLIEKNWKIYDIDINEDNNVFWKQKSKFGKNAHYEKNLSKVVKASVQGDFIEFCPGVDPTIEDGVIIIRVEENSEKIADIEV